MISLEIFTYSPVACTGLHFLSDANTVGRYLLFSNFLNQLIGVSIRHFICNNRIIDLLYTKFQEQLFHFYTFMDVSKQILNETELTCSLVAAVVAVAVVAVLSLGPVSFQFQAFPDGK